MVPDACFHTSNPIVIGVDVVEGVLKPGTPLVIPDRDVSITQTKNLFQVSNPVTFASFRISN